jgi:hypothetical protein
MKCTELDVCCDVQSRNDSIIVDWFQGQLKSKLVCPKCNRIANTFDPFMYLSLPIPVKMTRDITVTLFFRNPQRNPIKYRVTVEKYASVILTYTISLSKIHSYFQNRYVSSH